MDKSEVKKKKLYLVSNDYPNSGGDSVFIMPEIPSLAERYDLSVICMSGRSDAYNETPGIKYHYFNYTLSFFDKVRYFSLFWLKWDCIMECIEIFKSGHKILPRIYQSIGFFASAGQFYKYFIEILKKESCLGKGFVYYTYWAKYPTLAMALNKCKHLQSRLITRFHGCDLYDERFPLNRQPFRKLINQKYDQLWFVGETPRDYYLAKHKGIDLSKVFITRLGTRGIKRDKTIVNPSVLRLVSCSNFDPLKRVPLIASSLALINDVKIQWIHFGGDAELDEIRESFNSVFATKKNIEWKLMGYVENADVLDYYARESIDAFITVSSTEGAPVSIMEALSAGIPVIATDVGDISHMIQGCGILLQDNPTKEEVAQSVRRIYCLKNSNQLLTFQEMAVEKWRLFYDIEKNVERVVDLIG